MEYQRDDGPATEREWRCPQCGTLHGVVRGGKLHRKHKTAQFVVTGHVTAVCRRCSQLCETVVGMGPATRAWSLPRGGPPESPRETHVTHTASA